MGALLKVTLVAALLTLLGERIINFSHRTLIFNEVEPVDLPGCQLVKGIETGSEDIDVLPNGLAFISTGLKFPNVKSFAPDKPAEILLLNLEDGRLSPSPLPISEGFNVSSFNPRGLSTYIDEKDHVLSRRSRSLHHRTHINVADLKAANHILETSQDGTVYLFVANHLQLQSIIEIFKFQEKEHSLLHLKSVTHELLTSVNDIVAVGPESFYATIDFYFSNDHMKILELSFGLPWTGVVYYSPGDVRQVATGLNNGNGITISNDKEYIYAADFTRHTINVFKKNEDWSLTPVKAVDVNSLLDNLSVDPVTGDIWTGAHPNLYKVFMYNPDDPPGSEVIRVQNIHSDNPIITRVYVNNGSVIQGSSCASVYKGQLLVGTVFHRALHCPLE